MSGESTYQPNNGFTKWMDTRLPLLRLAHDSFVGLSNAEKPELLVDIWRYSDVLPCDANYHRHYFGNATTRPMSTMRLTRLSISCGT